jgi:hypothetical protein
MESYIKLKVNDVIPRSILIPKPASLPSKPLSAGSKNSTHPEIRNVKKQIPDKILSGVMIKGRNHISG